MKRLLSLAAAFVALGLAGCKDPSAPGDAAANSGNAATLGLVRAGSDVAIKGVEIRTPTDAIAGTNDEYYIVKFNFTNNQGNALIPKIDHFVIEDDQKRRFFGADSGSPALIGITNYDGQLKVGDSHDYTVGFRVPQNTQGTLFYDSTF